MCNIVVSTHLVYLQTPVEWGVSNDFRSIYDGRLTSLLRFLPAPLHNILKYSSACYKTTLGRL